MSTPTIIFTNELAQLEALERRWTAELEAMPLDKPNDILQPRLSATWALAQLRDRISRLREAQRRG